MFEVDCVRHGPVSASVHSACLCSAAASETLPGVMTTLTLTLTHCSCSHVQFWQVASMCCSCFRKALLHASLLVVCCSWPHMMLSCVGSWCHRTAWQVPATTCRTALFAERLRGWGRGGGDCTNFYGLVVAVHVNWVSCHHCLTCLQLADRGDAPRFGG
jgi:hypothetical protein